MLLDVARPFGLVSTTARAAATSDEFGFPDRFQSQIRGRLSYEATLAAYRRHSVFLNVNSVIDSPTACSRRVFELLACGTPVLSTPARAIPALLGDAVTIVASPRRRPRRSSGCSTTTSTGRPSSARGRRAVLGTHTYAERLWTILATAGFDLPARRRSDVTALAIAGDQASFRRAVDGIGIQSLPPEEVLIGAPVEAAVDEALDTLRRALPDATVRMVHQEQAAGASERLRELATIASTAWVAPFAADRAYAPGHLELLMACTAFGEAEAIGADPAAGASDPHTFVDALLPATAIGRRDAVATWGWPESADGSGAWFRRGARLYLAEGAGSTAGTGASDQAEARRAP